MARGRRSGERAGIDFNDAPTLREFTKEARIISTRSDSGKVEAKALREACIDISLKSSCIFLSLSFSFILLLVTRFIRIKREIRL